MNSGMSPSSDGSLFSNSGDDPTMIDDPVDAGASEVTVAEIVVDEFVGSGVVATGVATGGAAFGSISLGIER